MKVQMLSRQGEATLALARTLLGYQPGDRLPTFHSLARDFGCSNGTLQSALRVLEEAAAIKVEPRGRLGTFVVQIDHGLLWEFADKTFVSIAMPMPYSLRYEGLATGLQAAFRQARIPFTLQFVRGGRHRLRLLAEDKVDYALVSGFTAEMSDEVETVVDYGPGSYVGGHGIVMREGCDAGSKGLRLGVDPASVDQIHMTKLAFGDLSVHDLVKVSYQQLGRLFAGNHIDATVWNLDEIFAHLPVPVEVIELGESWESNTHAVILKKAGGADMAPVIDTLHSPLVVETANQVRGGDRIPTY